jgi:hypothetical protein
MDQLLRLLHHCGLPTTDVDLINTWGHTMGQFLKKAQPRATQVTYICTWVCMHVCTQAKSHAGDLYMYVCMYVYASQARAARVNYVCMYVCMYVWMFRAVFG